MHRASFLSSLERAVWNDSRYLLMRKGVTRKRSMKSNCPRKLVLRHTIIAGYPPEEWMAGFVAEASRMPIHSAVSASPPFHSSRRLTLNFSVKEH